MKSLQVYCEYGPSGSSVWCCNPSEAVGTGTEIACGSTMEEAKKRAHKKLKKLIKELEAL